MSIYNFVFSNKPSTRFSRHALFWFAWLNMYAPMTTIWRIKYMDFTPLKALGLSYMEIGLQLPVDMAFVYSIIYILIPRFLLRNKINWFFLLWFSSVIFFSLLNYVYFNQVVFPLRTALGFSTPPHTDFLYSFLSIINNNNMEAGFAISIRLLKIFIHQQSEMALFKKELAFTTAERETDAQLAETDFLEHFIDGIHQSQEGSPIEKTTFQKLKELVHYLSYDYKKRSIPIRTEVQAFADYLALKKALFGLNYCIENKTQALDENDRTMPLLLIPLAEPYLNFKHVCRQVNAGVQLSFDRPFFTCHMAFENLPADAFTAVNHTYFNRKLQLKYPQAFHLNRSWEDGKIRLFLQLDVSKRIGS